jgi:hypothetical protein
MELSSYDKNLRYKVFMCSKFDLTIFGYENCDLAMHFRTCDYHVEGLFSIQYLVISMELSSYD